MVKGMYIIKQSLAAVMNSEFFFWAIASCIGDNNGPYLAVWVSPCYCPWWGGIYSTFSA